MDVESIKALAISLIVAPFIVFQISIIIFIIVERTKKNKIYSSTFFLLFILITVVDTVAEIDTVTALQMPAIKFLEFLYLDNTVFAAIAFQLSSYTLFTQCYIHIGISINRFYTVLHTTKKSDPKYDTIGKILIWILPFLTIPFIAPRFWFGANFIRDENGRLWPSYSVSKDVRTFMSTYSTCLCAISSIISFVLQVFTVMKYKSLLNGSSSQSKTMKQEIRLFLQAMIALAAQLLMCILQLMMTLANAQGNKALYQFTFSNYVWIQNISNLTGPIALVIVGKRIREDYLRFILRKPQLTAGERTVVFTR